MQDLLNYLSRFLSNLIDLCEPHCQFTLKDTAWNWTDVHDQVFQKISQQHQYCNTSTQPSRRLYTVALGAALTQAGKPLAYASRSLSSAEQNYALINMNS